MHGGWIGPQMSPCIPWRKGMDSLVTFARDSLFINFPNEHAWQIVLQYTRSLLGKDARVMI